MLCLGLAVLAVLAGCGDEDDGGSGAAKGGAATLAAIDVGNGKPIEATTAKPRIALFWTSGNLFQEAYRQGAEEEAKRRGLDLTVLDAKFDPIRQMQQVQNALQQKRYDAFIALPLDGNTMCPVLSKEAPGQGVVVVTSIVSMCDLVNEDEGPSMAAPGTLAQVGNPGATNPSREYYRAVNERLDRRHTAALLVGPPLIAGSITSIEGLKQVQAKNEIPNLDVKYTINTDFTTPDGLEKTQTLLQAHPDVDVILSVYSDITARVIKAVKEAHKTGKIKVFDRGGSEASVAAIKACDLEMTTAAGYLPHTHGVHAVAAVAAAFAGKQVPRWVGAHPPGETPANIAAIDASNVGEFTPEY